MTLPALLTIPSMPGQARWNASIAMAHQIIDGVVGEMQDYFDDRSESWHQSERGDAHQERIDALGTALDALNDLIA